MTAKGMHSAGAALQAEDPLNSEEPEWAPRFDDLHNDMKDDIPYQL